MLGHERPGVALTFEDHGGETGIVPHLSVSWDAYWDMVDELIVRVARDPVWRPNQIVAITFGGILPARALSQTLGDVPVAYFAAESYRPAHAGDGRCMERTRLVFARDLLKTSPGFGDRVLVVDDLMDTGVTSEKCAQWLHRHPTYGMDLSCRTAFLWRKVRAPSRPRDPSAIVIDTVESVAVPGRSERLLPWIDQPLEAAYAVAKIDAIEARVRARSAAPHQ